MLFIKLSLQAFVITVMLAAQAAMASPVPAPHAKANIIIDCGSSVRIRVNHESCCGALNTVDGSRELARCKAKLRIQERMRQLGVNVDQHTAPDRSFRVQAPNYSQERSE